MTGVETLLTYPMTKGVFLGARSEKTFLSLWLTIKNMLKTIVGMIEKTTTLVNKATALVTALTGLGIALIPAIGLFTGTVHIDEIHPKLRYIEKIIDISTNKQQVDDKDTITIKKQLKQSPDLK